MIALLPGAKLDNDMFSIRDGTCRGRAVVPASMALCLVLMGWPLLAQVGLSRQTAQKEIESRLAKQEMAGALATYDEYVKAAKAPDVTLLRPIAEAELRRSGESGGVAAALALEGLARGGDRAALTALRQLADVESADSAEALVPATSLVRLGDPGAVKRLSGRLDRASDAVKPHIIEALRKADARSEAGRIAQLLGASDLRIRTAAVVAVGALQFQPAIPQLRTIFEADVEIVRMAAAIALKRLGDSSADAYVGKLLASEVPDAQLKAAESYGPANAKLWVPRVRALRNDRDPMVRLRAAEALACCDAASARAVLIDTLASAIPGMRAEAARVLDERDLADPRIARRLLSDDFPVIRAHGANEVIRLAAARPR